MLIYPSVALLHPHPLVHLISQRLADHIEGSRAAKLAKDSNNVVQLIRDNYEDISSEVKMVAESEAEDIKVKVFSRFLIIAIGLEWLSVRPSTGSF